MLVTLISKNFISRLTLPKIKMGNYWLYDKDYDSNMLKITNDSDKWILQSTSQYQIVNPKNIINTTNSFDIYRDGNEFLNSIELKDYNFYYVTKINSTNMYLIYCSPLYEKYFHLKIKTTNNFFYEINIGKDKSNHIVYNNPLICDKHAKITFSNGRYLIENYDKKLSLYVNDRPVSDSSIPVFNGDRIAIYGLNIILIADEIFINNPLSLVNCSNKIFELYLRKETILNTDDEEDFDKYLNKDLFFKKPRMLNQIDKSEIKIISPQVSNKSRELPLAVSLASSLSMALMTAITLSQTITNVASGQTQMKNAIFSFLSSGAMLITAILIPIITRYYNKKIKKLDEEDRAENYKKYIEKKNKQINDILNNNREILYETYPSANECTNIILSNQFRLWERQINDSDFLTVRLGIGDINSGLDIKSDDGESAADRTDELYKLQDDCIDKAKTLLNAPITLSLLEKNISAIVCQDKKLEYNFIQDLLIQLVTFQSYDDLKLVFLLKDNFEGQWNFVKSLPHIWDNLKEKRFFADTPEKIYNISQYLETILKQRIDESSSISNKNNPNKPHYLIIVDDFKSVEDTAFINYIFNSQFNLGVSILFVTDSIQKLPIQCKTIINIQKNNSVVFDSQEVKKSQLKFEIDDSNIFFFDKICQTLSNLLIKNTEEKESSLPSNYTFLEMYNVGNIEQLSIPKRWEMSDPTTSLAAPIGINSDGSLVSLDIHEKFHGPHGLVAGSTGSGKSEFIITYILSLAINYHPDDVTFVLIDYKGGGLTDAFKRKDIELPHLVGTITNIDKTNLQRSLESIQSELKRRQVEFSRAKNATNEGTMDIYKYQKYYHKGLLKKPLSHLLIISDEFAELKQQEPEFMDELISVARIGRSLGVHLILATQRPAGIITDQIRSNTKFGVCLKVQSTSDSKDIINLPDAAKLKRAGQFYLKVGNDDYLVLGQAAYAGAPYYPSNEIKKTFDDSIEFLNDTGEVLKTVNNIKENTVKNEGEQLQNIVQYICNIAKEKNIHEDPLWLNPIPETIYLKDLRKKYNVHEDDYIINPVIGEYDDPSNQLQNVMKLNIYSDGNIIIYGNATSGKETLLSTMIYDTINNYSSQRINMYILDFGSEAMKIFKDSNHIGDIMFANDKEKIARFFIMIQKELRQRIEILSKYNGNYELYIKSTNEIMPTILIIINNYESFVESYGSNYDSVLDLLLREGVKYQIIFLIITGSTSGIRYKTLQSFKQKIALRMNKDDDYKAIFDRLRNKTPSNLFGRGLVNLEPGKYFEFQTAKICKEDEWNDEITQSIIDINKHETFKAKPVPVMPNIVTIDNILSCINDLSSVPVGLSNKDIDTYSMNLQNFINIISTSRLENYKDFIINLIDVLKLIKNINLYIFDAEHILSPKDDEDLDNDDKDTTMDDYLKMFKSLNHTRKLKETVVVIIGLDQFISKMKPPVPEAKKEDVFNSSLQRSKSLKKVYYLLLDSYAKLNKHVSSAWYQKYVSGETGLWLGDNVTSQSLLKTKNSSFKLNSACGENFGYAMIKGVPTLIKLLGMKEPEKKDE